MVLKSEKNIQLTSSDQVVIVSEGSSSNILLPDVSESNNIVTEERIFSFVERQPSFPGGDSKLDEFLKKNFKLSTPAITGTVVVQFVVDKEGKISDPQIVKKLGSGVDEETIRVVKMLPSFTPAKQNGQPVAFRYTLPIRFKDGVYSRGF